MLYAHSRNAQGVRHDLGEHLSTVGQLAANFAQPFGGSDLARLAGLLHDIGKAHPDFQAYLAACEREPERRHPTVDHKGAGAAAGKAIYPPVAMLVQGHHGGLIDSAKLVSWLNEKASDPRSTAALEQARSMGFLEALDGELSLPRFTGNPRGFELFLRFCFSTLIDADRSDTEAHFNPQRASLRGSIELAGLAARLRTFMRSVSGFGSGAVNDVRHEVYEACVAAAPLAPGFFRLTVPTGGGKTLSGLSFAMEHGLIHGLRRVIVAVPYLTITDQTASVYRQVLGSNRAVLEHYSGAGDERDDRGGEDGQQLWRRLAAENWDAPVVVTTTVQLFESLFARSTGACRKLHRLAKSVVILDEAQALPAPLLIPILDALSELVSAYGASVVFCTATQPSFGRAPGFDHLNDVRELAPDPSRLFQTLRRVRYEWPANEERWDWARVAEEMRASDRVLTIVNTKAEALALLDALEESDALHLSTLLCGAHRREVLDRIRLRLEQRRSCQVVSTQVVEAGVDLDFPVVLRAMGPLDRIVQAAGRCNREGTLHEGRVVVFRPRSGGMPRGPYQIAAGMTEALLDAGPIDCDDPATFARYFASVFPLVDLDRKGIQRLRELLAFEAVAREFQMIEAGVSVLVPYRGMPGDPDGARHMQEVERLTLLLDPDRAASRPAQARQTVRAAQPYLVTMRESALREAAGNGLATELAGGIWKWKGMYDPVRGITGHLDPEALVI